MLIGYSNLAVYNNPMYSVDDIKILKNMHSKQEIHIVIFIKEVNGTHILM